jgi:hypothetical protein
MLPLGMEQVCQEKETVTVKAVKAAWEQAKEKVGVWEKAAAQMEEEIVHLIRDEERAEEGAPFVGTGYRSKNVVGCLGMIGSVMYFSLPLSCLFTLSDISNDLPTINTLFIVLSVLLFTCLFSSVVMLMVVIIEMVMGVHMEKHRCFPCNDSFDVIIGIMTFLHALLIPVVVSELIITVIIRSSLEGRKLFAMYIGTFSIMLAWDLLCLVVLLRQVFREKKSAKIKKETARRNLVTKEMANTIDAAVAVTRNWAATKSADLQKLLTTNDTPQVDLKTVLAALSKIETVIQICKKAQTMCQAAVSNPSTAAEQATEILQAITTVEGLLPEVEGMLPQPLHHPNIQIA